MKKRYSKLCNELSESFLTALNLGRAVHDTYNERIKKAVEEFLEYFEKNKRFDFNHLNILKKKYGTNEAEYAFEVAKIKRKHPNSHWGGDNVLDKAIDYSTIPNEKEVSFPEVLDRTITPDEMQLNMRSGDTMKEFINKFKSRKEVLDYLINNKHRLNKHTIIDAFNELKYYHPHFDPGIKTQDIERIFRMSPYEIMKYNQTGRFK